MLTKSLHTVTAVTNVARHLMNSDAINGNSPDDASPEYWVHLSLSILNYYETDYNDSTFLACVKSVRKMMGEK